MGTLHLISDQLPELLPQLSRDLTIPHVSSILRLIGIRNGTLKDYSNNSSPPRNKMELGNIFEQGRKYMYHQAYPGQVITPGEIVYDGVGLNMDMVSSIYDAVTEFKCSWFSSSKSMEDPEIMKFRDQLKSYTYVSRKLGLTDSLEGHLEIVYPRGNYKTNDADYGHWIEEYTEEELEKHWRMIMNHRHLVKLEEK